MKFIHVSDRHYGQPGATQANARINNAICERPDIAQCAIIDTGDVVDSPSLRQYKTATSALLELSELAGEFLLLPGNHDLAWAGVSRSLAAPALWGDHVEELTGSRPTYPSLHIIDGIAVIAIDTNRQPPNMLARQAAQITATGFVGDRQIFDVVNMVRKARSFDLPIIVAMHHCPSGGDPLLRLSDRLALGNALESAGGVDLMLTGHLHQKREWSGVFGARFLLASPKTPGAQGYREIWWDAELKRFRWGWVEA